MNSTPSIRTVFASVLEEYAFMFAEPPAVGQHLTPPDAFHLVTIHYGGSHAGTVYIAADPGFCHSLHENMLGATDSEEEREAGAADALKELCNVVAGQWVTERHGTQGRYELSIPELRPGTREDWDRITGELGASPLLVDQEFTVVVALEEST